MLRTGAAISATLFLLLPLALATPFNKTGICDAFAHSPQCVFSLGDAQNATYDFDLRGLCSPQGYNVTQPTNVNTWRLNICGFSPWICTPEYELRTSRGVGLQFNGPDPANCDLSCKDWDTLQPACCFAPGCAVYASQSFYTLPNDMANLATGGVTIYFAQSPISATDPFPCPQAPSPRTLEVPRQLTITLLCDTTTNDTTLVSFDQISESVPCIYSLTGYTAAACGKQQVLPSPSSSNSATPSGSTTASVTPSSSRTSSASGTQSGSPSLTGTSSPSQTQTGTPTPVPTPSTPSGYVYFSGLDRDLSIASGGLFTGILLSALVVMGSYRRMFPWQWGAQYSDLQQPPPRFAQPLLQNNAQQQQGFEPAYNEGSGGGGGGSSSSSASRALRVNRLGSASPSYGGLQQQSVVAVSNPTFGLSQQQQGSPSSFAPRGSEGII